VHVCFLSLSCSIFPNFGKILIFFYYFFYYSSDEFLCSFVFILQFAFALRLLKHQIISQVFDHSHTHQIFCCCHLIPSVFPLAVFFKSTIMKTKHKYILSIECIPINCVQKRNLLVLLKFRSFFFFCWFIPAFSFSSGLVFF